MKGSIAEWLWRVALLVALAWIGWELQLLHEDMNQPVGGDQSTVAATADDTQDSLDAIRDDIAGLTRKMDAMLIAMAQARP
jgi:hypothetical protein